MSDARKIIPSNRNDYEVVDETRLSQPQIKWLFANKCAKHRKGKIVIDWKKAKSLGWKRTNLSDWEKEHAYEAKSAVQKAFESVAFVNLAIPTAVLTKANIVCALYTGEVSLASLQELFSRLSNEFGIVVGNVEATFPENLPLDSFVDLKLPIKYRDDNTRTLIDVPELSLFISCYVPSFSLENCCCEICIGTNRE